MNKNITIVFAILLLCLAACDKKKENAVETKKAEITEQRADTVEQEEPEKVMFDTLTYVDKKFKVLVRYPNIFVLSDAAQTGTKFFYYPSKQSPKIVMRLLVEETKSGWKENAAVRSATEAFLEKKGKGYYIFSGSGWWYHQNFFREKVFMVDGKWMDLTMYYSDMDMEIMFDLLDNWKPFDNMKKHRLVKPVIDGMKTREVGRCIVYFEFEEEEIEDIDNIDNQDVRKAFNDKSSKRLLLYSKNMGGKKKRSFYSMEAGDGIALVVHDNWNGSVRSLTYSKKDVTPKEGCYPDVSGFASPDGRYFFAVYCNQRNGRLSWPYEYDIYRIDTRTLNGRYITACGTCYVDKRGFTVVTGKYDSMGAYGYGANLDRYETYDFTGRRVSVSKYIPEEKFRENFKHKDNTNLKFF